MSAAAQLPAVAVVQAAGCDLLTRVFAKHGWRLAVADTPERGLAAIRASAAIVILDRDLAGDDWRPVLRSFTAEPNCACVILASRVVDDYLWQEVLRHGGYDVIAKPFEEREVVHTLEFAWPVMKSRLCARHTG